MRTKYWLTTQYPPYRGETELRNRAENSVWIPERRQSAARDLVPGDLVWVYETKTRRIERGKRPYYREGEQGVTVLMQVQKVYGEGGERRPTTYQNGDQVIWVSWADCRVTDSQGFVPMEELNSILRYKPAYNLHGFNGGSGLRPVSPEEHDRIFQLYGGGTTMKSDRTPH